MISICTITDNVYFDNLANMVTSRFFYYVKLLFSTLYIIPILWGDTLKLCKYSISYQTFNISIYLSISVWTHGFQFYSMVYNPL